MRYKEVISTCANTLIVVLAIVLIAGIARNMLIQPPRPAIAIGSTLTLPPSASTTAGKERLVIAVRNGCHFCKNSAPFYNQLARAWKTRELRAVPVIVDPDTGPTQDTDWPRTTLGIPVISDVALSSIGVTGTPTLILLNPKGQVVKVWVGELNKDQQLDVLDTLRMSS